MYLFSQIIAEMKTKNPKNRLSSNKKREIFEQKTLNSNDATVELQEIRDRLRKLEDETNALNSENRNAHRLDYAEHST